jgi:choloylglycine hydrolase
MIFLISLAEACTWFELPVNSGPYSHLFGRTMEIDNPFQLPWTIQVTPRTNSTFGYVSVRAKYDLPAEYTGVTDPALQKDLPKDTTQEGMNEFGLSISANTFREAQYENETGGDKPKLLWASVNDYVLSKFKTVAEAVAGLDKVAVVVDTNWAMYDPGFQFHWAIVDDTSSAIVEYIDGKMKVYKKDSQQTEHVGVMTNDPPYDWMLKNLNTYVNLSPVWPDRNANIQVETASGSFPQPVGMGWNLVGLPGDPTPPARFARTFFHREYAISNMPESVENLANATRLATGLINNVFLIPGTIAKLPAANYEFTPYAVVKIPHPTEAVLLIRSATNMQWQQIQFNQVDFDKAADWVISRSDLGINDITDEFSNSTVTDPNRADWYGTPSSSLRHIPGIFVFLAYMI